MQIPIFRGGGRVKKVKLGDLGKIITGNTPSKKLLEFYNSNDIPFIKPDDFKTTDEISTSKGNKNYISENARNNARIVPQNSVLVTCIGIIGKVMISESELSFNQQINAIVPNELILSKYLAYLLLYNKPKLDFISNAPVVPIINKTQFSEFEVTFHEYIDVQEKIIQNLENLDNQILKRRYQSKLLLNLVKSRFNEMFGDPVLNEMRWEIETLNKIGTIGRGVSKHRPRNASELFGGIYPFIQTGDVANSGNYIVDYHSTYSEFGLKQSKLWDKGTLCITIAASIAKTSILAFDSCFPDSIVGFIPGERTNNIFIHYWFSYFQKILESQAPESAQKNINLKILSELKVILPPLSLQNEFADFVAQVDKSQFACQKAIKLWRNSLKSSII